MSPEGSGVRPSSLLLPGTFPSCTSEPGLAAVHLCKALSVALILLFSCADESSGILHPHTDPPQKQHFQDSGCAVIFSPVTAIKVNHSSILEHQIFCLPGKRGEADKTCTCLYRCRIEQFQETS